MTCEENTSPPAGRNCGKPSEKTRGALLAAIRKKNNQTTHSLARPAKKHRGLSEGWRHGIHPCGDELRKMQGPQLTHGHCTEEPCTHPAHPHRQRARSEKKIAGTSGSEEHTHTHTHTHENTPGRIQDANIGSCSQANYLLRNSAMDDSIGGS